MKKLLALIFLLIALPVYAERAHIGDYLATDDLTNHIIGTADQVTVTGVGDTAVLSLPTSVAIANLTVTGAVNANTVSATETVTAGTGFVATTGTLKLPDVTSTEATLLYIESVGAGSGIGLAQNPSAFIKGVANQTTSSDFSDGSTRGVEIGTVQGIGQINTPTFNSVIINSGANRRVPFLDSSKTLTTDTGFIYNSTSDRLGIGIGETGIWAGGPRAKLEIYSSTGIPSLLLSSGVASAYTVNQPNNANGLFIGTGTPDGGITNIASFTNNGVVIARNRHIIPSGGPSNVLIVNTGSTPSSNITNAVYYYAGDCTAGNACPTMRTETGTTIQLDQSVKTTDNVQHLGLGIGNTVGTEIDLDVWQRTGDGAASFRIATFSPDASDGLHLSIINGLDPTKTTFAASAEIASLWFDKPNSVQNANIRWYGPTYSNASFQNDLMLSTANAGDIYLRPATQYALKATSARNIFIGADLTATTGMVNSAGIATGECGTTSPSTYATLCVEPVTTAAGTSTKVMRVRHGDGNETTLTSLYGNIYTLTNATTAVTGYAFANISGVSNSGVSRGTTENGTSGFITVLNAGVYHVQANLSMSGGVGLNNQIVKGRIAVNGTPSNFGFMRKIATGTDVGAAGANGLLSLNANDRVSLMVNSTATGEDITAENFSLTIAK